MKIERFILYRCILTLPVLFIIYIVFPWQSAFASLQEQISPPATYYGQVLSTARYVPSPGQTINAYIRNTQCGQSATQQSAGVVVYSIDVESVGPSGQPNCGVTGKKITFYIQNIPMQPVLSWSGDGYHEQNLQANSLPIAKPDLYNTLEDSPILVNAPGILANDTDADGASLTAIKLTNANRGSLLLNANGSFSYNTLINDNGIVTFTYQISDGLELSTPAKVTINITAVNDPPVANVDIYSGTMNSLLTVLAPGVLGNDADIDSSNILATLVTSTQNGILQLNNNGSFTYSPHADFSGKDSFTYQAYDGELKSAPVIVQLRIGSSSLRNWIYLPIMIRNIQHILGTDHPIHYRK